LESRLLLKKLLKPLLANLGGRILLVLEPDDVFRSLLNALLSLPGVRNFERVLINAPGEVIITIEVLLLDFVVAQLWAHALHELNPFMNGARPVGQQVLALILEQLDALDLHVDAAFAPGGIQ